MEAQPAVVWFDKTHTKKQKTKKRDGVRELDPVIQKTCRFSNFKWT